MRYKVITFTASIFLIALIQTTILNYISVFNVKPNLLMIFVIAVALLRGNVEGAVVGFFCGLVQDATSGSIFGLYTLLGMYTGLIIGSVNKRLYRENFFVIIFFTFISTAVYEFSVYILRTFDFNQANLLYSLRSVVLPEAIYNGIASIFIYIIVIRMNYRLEAREKSARRY